MNNNRIGITGSYEAIDFEVHTRPIVRGEEDADGVGTRDQAKCAGSWVSRIGVANNPISSGVAETNDGEGSGEFAHTTSGEIGVGRYPVNRRVAKCSVASVGDWCSLLKQRHCLFRRPK